MSTKSFQLEISSILKAIKSHFNVSCDEEENLTIIVISCEIYETRRKLVSYEMTTCVRSSIYTFMGSTYVLSSLSPFSMASTLKSKNLFLRKMILHFGWAALLPQTDQRDLPFLLQVSTSMTIVFIVWQCGAAGLADMVFAVNAGSRGSISTGGTCPNDFSDPIDQDIRTQCALS